MPKLSHRQWLVIIFVVALLLRVPTLRSKSLWLDEAYSVYQGEREELARLVFVEGPHPPLYYTLLHYWMGVAGKGEAAVRLPSAAASLANVGLLYLVARTVAGRETALLAAALLAVSPLDVWYAQEARMPIFVAFFALSFALALLWNHPLRVPVGAIALGTGLYIDYVIIPLWLGISAVGFAYWVQRPQGPRPYAYWLAASLGGWLLYRGWWSYLHQSLEGSIGSVLLFTRARAFLGLSHLGTAHFAAGLTVAAVGLALGAIAAGWLLRRSLWARLATTAAFNAVVFVALLMVAPRLFTVKRVLVTGWPWVLLLLAWLLTARGSSRRRLQWPALIISLLATLTVLTMPKDDWRGATRYVESAATADAPIWLDPGWNHFPYNYYAERTAPVSGTVEELAAAASENDEIWLIAERFPSLPTPSSLAEAWLDENWKLVHQQPFYRLEVRGYRPR